jgi:hypothetical protein
MLEISNCGKEPTSLVTAAFIVTNAFGVYFYILCLSTYNLGTDCNYAKDGVVILATRSRKVTSHGTWGTQPSVLRAAVASNCPPARRWTYAYGVLF